MVRVTISPINMPLTLTLLAVTRIKAELEVRSQSTNSFCWYLSIAPPSLEFEPTTVSITWMDGNGLMTTPGVRLCIVNDEYDCVPKDFGSGYPNTQYGFMIQHLREFYGISLLQESLAIPSGLIKVSKKRLEKKLVRLENQFLSLSCKSGICGLESKTCAPGPKRDISRPIRLNEFQKELETFSREVKVGAFLVGDTCSYVRESRGQKFEALPGAGIIQRMANSPQVSIGICFIQEADHCYPDNMEEFNHFVEYLKSAKEIPGSLAEKNGLASNLGSEEVRLTIQSWNCVSGVCDKKLGTCTNDTRVSRVWKMWESPLKGEYFNASGRKLARDVYVLAVFTSFASQFRLII